jgi:hypothetical protein
VFERNRVTIRVFGHGDLILIIIHKSEVLSAPPLTPVALKASIRSSISFLFITLIVAVDYAL